MNPRPVVTLDHLPAVLTLDEYAEAMRTSERTVRRQLAAGVCVVPPRLVQPYRWMRVDLEAYLSSTSLPQERRRLMRLATTAVLLLVCASVTAAQTLGPVTDKAPLGLAGATVWPAELDGDPVTPEWIGMRYDAPTDRVLYRSVVLRGARICQGPEFDIVALIGPDLREVSVLLLQEVRGIWMFVVQGERYYREIRIEMPSC